MAEEPPKIVSKIEHILKNHRTLPLEQADYVNAWLERISKAPQNENERSNLLQYAKFLEYQLKYRNLSHPFDQPPPREIAPLSVVINEQLDLNDDDQAQEASTSKSRGCKAKEKKPLCDWGQSTWIRNMKEQDSGPQEQCNDINACKEILNETKKNNLPLAEFLTKIVPYTDDNGELIREVAYNELKAFRELVFRIFSDRIQQVDKIHSSTQCIRKYEYSIMEQHQLNRAKIAQNYLKQLLPGFNYDDYINESNYIRDILIEVDKKHASETNCEPNFLSPENSLKQQQFKLKFLKDELRRREQDNEELMDEHNNLMLQLNQAIKEQQEKSKHNIKRNKDLKDKLAGLKITAEENQVILDKILLENGPTEN
ncbi:hypothetical protein M8J76_007004 [Diaphorina citri]|nr:hypothetical protein M8J75_002427 [Diaphorina citri]KAI5744963.1 hypothetical protein M8J76_007004 [Diaphorina citri]